MTLGIAISVSVMLLCPSAVYANSLIDITENETKTSVKEFIDSSLIKGSLSDLNTGNTDNGSNSSAIANSNKGDGINSNVATSDIVTTDVNINITGNTITHDESTQTTTDNSTSSSTITGSSSGNSDYVTIKDEDTPLSSYLLAEGWEIVSKIKPQILPNYHLQELLEH